MVVEVSMNRNVQSQNTFLCHWFGSLDCKRPSQEPQKSLRPIEGARTIHAPKPELLVWVWRLYEANQRSIEGSTALRRTRNVWYAEVQSQDIWGRSTNGNYGSQDNLRPVETSLDMKPMSVPKLQHTKRSFCSISINPKVLFYSTTPKLLTILTPRVQFNIISQFNFRLLLILGFTPSQSTHSKKLD